MFMGYLMTKPPSKKNRSGVKPIAGRDKEVYIFCEGISPKVNVIV